MLDKFDESLGEKLGEKWAPQLLSLSTVFWGGGLAVWAMTHKEEWDAFLSWLGRSSQITQGSLLVLGFLLVLASNQAAQHLSSGTLRLFEGYWPVWARPLRRLKLRLVVWRLGRHETRFQELESKRNNLTPAEADEHAKLDWRLIHTPAARNHLMPTRMGNILRSCEARPAEKYGLDVVVCWPRLWLLLPEDVKAEVTGARATLDAAAQACLWALLLLVWCVWSWWVAPVALLILFFAYWRMLSIAQIYGSLVEAAFDVHRARLYLSLRWPLPRRPSEERQVGASLTAYLWRGSEESSPEFRGTGTDSGPARSLTEQVG